MKIVGITTKNDDKLLSFTLSLFDNTRTQIRSFDTLGADEFDGSIGLVVMSIDVNNINDIMTNSLLSSISVPIFLLCSCTQNEFDEDSFQIEGNYLEVFILPKSSYIFENGVGLADIPKRIELCRKVNAIQCEKFRLRDSASRNCGIVRNSLEVGDECDY